MPWMIRRALGDRVALVFAFLLAVSPFLVFYGRFARAYSLSALLCLAALLLSHRWLRTGRASYAVGYVVVGTLAVYVHLFSLVAVSAPLLAAFASLLASRLGVSSSASDEIVARPSALAIAGAFLAASIVPVVASVLLGGAKLPWAKGTPTVGGFLTALSMISGTASVPWNLVVYTLCVPGHVLLWKEKPLLGRMFLWATGLYVVVLLVSRPKGIETGLVLLRYMIVAVPIALIAVAVAVERVASRLAGGRPDARSAACAASGIALAGGLFLAGPLPGLESAPNDFTGHSAFQGSYEPLRWDRSDARHVYPAFSLRSDQIPSFYRWLRDRADIAVIVEYPFDVCNHNDLFYYYQHFHGKRVLAGYCSDPRRIGDRAVRRDEGHLDSVLSMLSADEILSRVPADGRVAFRNMVDVTSRGALVAGGAGIVVMHKVVMGLRVLAGGAMDAVPVHYTSVDRLGAAYLQAFGPPVYEDAEIVCFRIPPAGGGMEKGG
jgi:hypothetical protein